MGRLNDGRRSWRLKTDPGTQPTPKMRCPAATRWPDRELLLSAFELVCPTVAYAHAQADSSTADLKPSNVMVWKFGESRWWRDCARGLDDADDSSRVHSESPNWDEPAGGDRRRAE